MTGGVGSGDGVVGEGVVGEGVVGERVVEEDDGSGEVGVASDDVALGGGTAPVES